MTAPAIEALLVGFSYNDEASEKIDDLLRFRGALQDYLDVDGRNIRVISDYPCKANTVQPSMIARWSTAVLDEIEAFISRPAAAPVTRMILLSGHTMMVEQRDRITMELHRSAYFQCPGGSRLDAGGDHIGSCDLLRTLKAIEPQSKVTIHFLLDGSFGPLFFQHSSCKWLTSSCSNQTGIRNMDIQQEAAQQTLTSTDIQCAMAPELSRMTVRGNQIQLRRPSFVMNDEDDEYFDLDHLNLAIWTASRTYQHAIEWSSKSLLLHVWCQALELYRSAYHPLKSFAMNCSGIGLLNILSHYASPSNEYLEMLMPSNAPWISLAPPSYRPNICLGYSRPYCPATFKVLSHDPCPYPLTRPTEKRPTVIAADVADDANLLLIRRALRIYQIDPDETLVHHSDTVGATPRIYLPESLHTEIFQILMAQLHTMPQDWQPSSPILSPDPLASSSITSNDIQPFIGSLMQPLDVMMHLTEGHVVSDSSKSELKISLHIVTGDDAQDKTQEEIEDATLEEVTFFRNKDRVFHEGPEKFNLGIVNPRSFRFWRHFPIGTSYRTAFKVYLYWNDHSSQGAVLPGLSPDRSQVPKAIGHFTFQDVLKAIQGKTRYVVINFPSYGPTSAHLAFQCSSSSAALDGAIHSLSLSQLSPSNIPFSVETVAPTLPAVIDTSLASPIALSSPTSLNDSATVVSSPIYPSESAYSVITPPLMNPSSTMMRGRENLPSVLNMNNKFITILPSCNNASSTSSIYTHHSGSNTNPRTPHKSPNTNTEPRHSYPNRESSSPTAYIIRVAPPDEEEEMRTTPTMTRYYPIDNEIIADSEQTVTQIEEAAFPTSSDSYPTPTAASNPSLPSISLFSSHVLPDHFPISPRFTPMVSPSTPSVDTIDPNIINRSYYKPITNMTTTTTTVPNMKTEYDYSPGVVRRVHSPSSMPTLGSSPLTNTTIPLIRRGTIQPLPGHLVTPLQHEMILKRAPPTIRRTRTQRRGRSTDDHKRRFITTTSIRSIPSHSKTQDKANIVKNFLGPNNLSYPSTMGRSQAHSGSGRIHQGHPRHSRRRASFINEQLQDLKRRRLTLMVRRSVSDEPGTTMTQHSHVISEDRRTKKSRRRRRSSLSSMRRSFCASTEV